MSIDPENIPSLTTDEVIAQRNEVHAKVAAGIQADEHILGALFIGSVANSGADEYSDLDYYFYADRFPWSGDDVRAWLGKNALNCDLDYWNRTHKHHLIVAGTFVDIAVWHERQRLEIVHWPALAFDESNIIKDDAEGTIRRAIKEHGPTPEPDPENDYDGYIIGLFDVARTLTNPQRTFESAVYTKADLTSHMARVMLNLPFGTSDWARPLRHAEERLSQNQVAELHRSQADFLSAEYRAFIAERLAAVRAQTSNEHVAQLAEYYQNLLVR